MPAEQHARDDARFIPELELEILRVICTMVGSSDAIRSALHALANHAWHEPEYRVVFDALRRIHPARAHALREELPGIATRMGFPDIDWAPYFHRSTLSHEKFEAAVRSVISATEPPQQ